MLLFQGFEFLDIGHIQPPVFGLPLVKGGGCDTHFTAVDPGGYTGFMLLKGLNDLTSVNRDFFMVFKIKEISLLSKACILGVLTYSRFHFCNYLKVILIPLENLDNTTV